MYGDVVTLLCILGVGLQMTNFWYMHKGNKYATSRLSVAAGVTFMVTDTLVGFYLPEQRGLLVLNILYAWMIGIGIRGWRETR